MNISLKEKNGLLMLTASLEFRKRDEKVIYYDTKDILKWLKENHPEYTITNILEVPQKPLHNSMGAKRLCGEWVFDLRESKVVEKRQTTKTKNPNAHTKKVIKPMQSKTNKTSKTSKTSKRKTTSPSEE